MANRTLRTAGDYALAKALFGLTKLVGALPIDRALDTAHAIGTRLGPRASRHRIVLENLDRALPDTPRVERERIAREMWGHQARLIVETAFPDRLFDVDGPNARVEITGRDVVRERAAAGIGTLFFTGHTGCFEFLPAASRALDYPMATLFRPPNNRFIADRLQRQREGTNGRLVPARAGAARALATELRGGRGVGVLVDQKFRGGPMVPFFGHPAPTNPLVVRLAALTGGLVVPTRCVRLSGNRYRIEIAEPIQLPRALDGAIDVPASLAGVNGVVETWVREHPEQWMWFHRRWG